MGASKNIVGRMLKFAEAFQIYNMNGVWVLKQKYCLGWTWHYLYIYMVWGVEQTFDVFAMRFVWVHQCVTDSQAGCHNI